MIQDKSVSSRHPNLVKSECSEEPLTQETGLRQHENPIVQGVFTTYKNYLEDKIDEKRKQSEKGKDGKSRSDKSQRETKQ